MVKEMRITGTRLNFSRGLCLLFIAVFFTACQGASIFSYEGRMTNPENRIPLSESGKDSGVYQTRDISVNYKYFAQGEVFDMSGRVDLEPVMKTYPYLYHFDLQVHFLDDTGRIIGTKTLVYTGSRYMSDSYRLGISFDHSIPLPEGAKMIKFGYWGKASDGGGGNEMLGAGGSLWGFWEKP
jgi:hypothetical protein